MDNLQIERIMSILGRSAATCSRELPADCQFAGVHSMDRLELADLKQRGLLRVCILNTDNSSSAGEHWIVAGIDWRNGGEPRGLIFDSLGRTLHKSHTGVREHFRDAGVLCIYRNADDFQDRDVDSCALHSLYVAWLLVGERLDFGEVLRMYDARRPLLNDCRLLENFSQFLACAGSDAEVKLMLEAMPDTVSLCD